MVQGEGRSMPSLVQIRPIVWEENGDKQTNKQANRQTDTPFCFIYIDTSWVRAASHPLAGSGYPVEWSLSARQVSL